MTQPQLNAIRKIVENSRNLTQQCERESKELQVMKGNNFFAGIVKNSFKTAVYNCLPQQKIHVKNEKSYEIFFN